WTRDCSVGNRAAIPRDTFCAETRRQKSGSVLPTAYRRPRHRPAAMIHVELRKETPRDEHGVGPRVRDQKRQSVRNFVIARLAGGVVFLIGQWLRKHEISRLL